MPNISTALYVHQHDILIYDVSLPSDFLGDRNKRSLTPSSFPSVNSDGQPVPVTNTTCFTKTGY